MDPSEDARDSGAVLPTPARRPIVLRSILPGDRSRVIPVPMGTHSIRSGTLRGPSGGTVLVSGG
jgi:hypothetical protein